MSAQPISRRALVGSASGAVLLLTGCDIDPPAHDSKPRGESPATPHQAGDDDTSLVADVVAQLDRTATAVIGASALARLRPVLGPLTALHQAQRAVLSPDDSEAPADVDPSPATNARRALADVRRHESALQRSLQRAANAATSGDLARVLASAAAAVAQQISALPTGEPS